VLIPRRNPRTKGIDWEDLRRAKATIRRLAKKVRITAEKQPKSLK
jgi:hypothetical protein